MRIGPDGGTGVAPQKPQQNTSSSTSATTATTAASPASNGAGPQGAQSTATWPADQIEKSTPPGPMAKLEAMAREQDAQSGTFNDGVAGQSPTDQKIASIVAKPVWQAAASGRALSSNDTYELNQYVAGKIPGQDKAPAATRLQSAMAALGPDGTADWLQSMNQSDYDKLGIASSFHQLVNSGALTPADAKALAAGEGDVNTSANPNFTPSTIAGLTANSGNSANAVAFKNAYAQGALNEAGSITSNLESGGYKDLPGGQNQARDERMQQYANATAVLNATPNDDDAKRAAFEQMASDASGLRSAGNPSAANQIDAYALDALGHASPAAMAAELRSYGGSGIDAHGNVDPHSKLGTLIGGAVAGQASFGTNIENVPGYGSPPNGVSSVLNGLAKSGDPKLTQGVLSNVIDAMQQNGNGAQLAAQGTQYGTGIQHALTNALGSSFDQYLSNQGKPGVDPTKAAQLTYLAGFENGPPFEKGAASSYESMMQGNIQRYVDAGLGNGDDKLRQSFGSSDPADRGLMTAGALIAAYDIGSKYEQAGLTAQAAGQKTPDPIGTFLNGASGVGSIGTLVPGLDGPAGVASGVIGALSALHGTFGVLAPNPDSAAKSALAKLQANEKNSGATTASSAMNAYFENLYDRLNNANPQYINDLSGDSIAFTTNPQTGG